MARRDVPPGVIAPVAEPPGPTSTAAPTTSPPTTRAPVPLPADPAAVVLRVSRLGGYPFPGSSQRVQPIELHAGGRLVRPAPFPPPDPASAHHRLEAFEVPVAEVQALVAAAEDGGATARRPSSGATPAWPTGACRRSRSTDPGTGRRSWFGTSSPGRPTPRT